MCFGGRTIAIVSRARVEKVKRYRKVTDRSYRKRIYPRYTSNRMPAFLMYSELDYARAAKPILHRLRGWLPAERKSHCLDVACGVGQLLYALKTAGYTNLCGVDISPEQVAAAKRVWSDVREADAISFLRSHTENFHFITCFDIVEHFAKDELFDFLDALYGALRPGGRVIFQTPNAESPWGLMLRYGDLTHELAFDPNSLSHALSLAGFNNFEVRGSGPYIHGMRSLVRWVMWRGISAGLRLWNLAETGSAGSGVYTRVFVAKADKPIAVKNDSL